jgi:ketosteroid isomerase-like protein
MNDERVWNFEKSLWTGDADHYRELIDDECLMVLPEPPYVMTGQQAIEAVADTPRWSRVELSDQRIARPQEGLIVIAYEAEAYRDGQKAYKARCTSTYRRLDHEQWRVIQHQQTPPLVASS